MAEETKKTETTQAQILGKIRKTADTLTGKLKEYNEKYVAETVEKGKDTLKQYNDKYVSNYVEKGKNLVEGPYKKVSAQVDELLEKGRKIEKDVMKKFDEVLEKGKKTVSKLPMAETVEKKVKSGLNAVPSLVNLPVKEDIEKLTKAVDALNKNIEDLKKKAA